MPAELQEATWYRVDCESAYTASTPEKNTVEIRSLDSLALSRF